MAILVHLDVVLAQRKVKSRELAAHVGITEQNLSLLKSGKVRGIRFATLERICEYLSLETTVRQNWMLNGPVPRLRALRLSWPPARIPPPRPSVA